MKTKRTDGCAGLFGFLLLAAVSAGCRPAGAEATAQGVVLYESCVSCHGPTGEGKQELAAPAIAALPKWYIVDQLKKFRTGVRGAHPDDAEGLRMRPMSRQMANDREIDHVASYVASLPPPKSAGVVHGGDAGAGKVAYGVCSACHGPDGKGNEALKAPPLAGQSSWYLMNQLHKFKSGVRGAAQGDVGGAQMRPMAMTLSDEQAMKNVLAHIATMTR